MKAFEVFQANIKAKHSDVVQHWEFLLRDITKGDKNQALHACKLFLQSLIALNDIIKADGSPTWLTEMIRWSQQLSDNHRFSQDDNRTSYFKRLIQYETQMRNFSYAPSKTENVQPILNLEEVIAKHHDQDKLNSLYDSAIEHIEHALASGRIDSKRITEDLTRILASIQHAKTSSFVTQRVEVSNLNEFLKAIAKASAKKLPVIGEVLQVLDEANQELQASNNDIMAELKKLSEGQAQLLSRYIESQPVLIETQAEIINADFQHLENKPEAQ